MSRTCPTTSTVISERSHALNCNQTYQYHCMRDKEDQIVEKCLEISWIVKGDCAVYDNDTQTIDSWKCIERQGICPKEVYLSNQTISFSACVPSPKQTNSTNEKDFATDGRGLDGNDNMQFPLIIAAVLPLIAVIVIIVSIVIYKNWKRSSSDRASQAKHRDGEEKGMSDFEEESLLYVRTDNSEMPTRTRYDIDPYYKTKTFEHIEMLLEDSAGTILLIGHPGSGKSVIVEMLRENFRRKGVNVSLRLNCLEDVYEEESMIYFVDDCFEDWNQYPHLVSNGLKQFHNVHEEVVKGKSNSVVITMSKWNFDKNLNADERAKLKQCDKLKVVDLTTKDFELDITDKTGILEYHRKGKGSTALRMDNKGIRKVTDPGSLQNIVSLLEFAFPLSCRLFYSHDCFVAQKEDFFNETKRKIIQYIRGLKRGSSEEKSQFCTLIYMALCGGKIPANKENISFLKKIAKAATLRLPNLDFDYGSCLVIKANGMHEIIHDEITQLLFTAFGNSHGAFVIENCEVEVLLKYVRTDDRQRRGDYLKYGLLILTNNLYGRFLKRLHHLDKEALKHIIFKDQIFYRKLKKSMKEIKNGETEL